MAVSAAPRSSPVAGDAGSEARLDRRCVVPIIPGRAAAVPSGRRGLSEAETADNRGSSNGRTPGSGPGSPGSNPGPRMRPVSLVVRTPASHAGSTGSNPVRATRNLLIRSANSSWEKDMAELTIGGEEGASSSDSPDHPETDEELEMTRVIRHNGSNGMFWVSEKYSDETPVMTKDGVVAEPLKLR